MARERETGKSGGCGGGCASRNDTGEVCRQEKVNTAKPKGGYALRG